MFLDEILLVSLQESLGEAAYSEELDAILDNLKTLATETLPEGWREHQVLNLSKTELFGEEFAIDIQVLNNIKFALPTVGIARAFDPGVLKLSSGFYAIRWRTSKIPAASS